MRCKWLIVVAVAVLVALSRPRIVPSTHSSLELTRLQAIQQLKAMPIAFEANVGQTDATASFVARGSGYAMWATGEGPVLRLTRREAGHPAATVRLRVVGGEMAERPSAETLLPGRSNYFIGNDPSRWKTGVQRYGALRYEDVYPGIDLVLHGTQEQLEYDFDVAPGTDPSRIAVAFDGAQSLHIEANGDLTLTIADGELAFRPPVAYQEKNGAREFVPARYELAENNVMAFGLGEYDRSRTLIIDPVLSYSTYLGGQKNNGGNIPVDNAWDVAVDNTGYAYLVGDTNAVDFPMAGTSYDTFCNGCTSNQPDAFIAKIDPSQSGAASLVYSTYLGAGGTATTTATAIAVDGSGHVYVTGYTSGFGATAFPTTANAFQTSDGGDLAGSDGFLTKFDATGSSLLYSTYIGGNNVDEANDVKVDDAGHAVVVGRTASATGTFLELKNGIQMSNAGVFDAFVAKFDTSLSGGASLIYGTLLGGSSSDAAGSVALDSIGRIYVTGDTQSGGASAIKFPTLNGFQTSSSGGQHAFMAKIDPAAAGGASLLYSTFIASSTGTEGASAREGGIAVASNGVAYVTGSTFGWSGGTFPTTPGAFKTTLQNQDAYVLEIDATQSGAASLVAGTLLGGSFFETSTGVTIDSQGNPVIVGSTQSADFNVTACALPTKQMTNTFVVVMNPLLSSLKYSTTLGGDGGDWAQGVGLGPQGQIYVAGRTDSKNFPTTANAYDQTDQSQCNGCGSMDAFLSVITLPLGTCTPPTASAPTVTTAEDTPVSATLNATDAGGNSVPAETLTWTITSQPSHGLLGAASGTMVHGVGTAYSGSVQYTPTANYNGPDSFKFQVNDGTDDSNEVTVAITVTPVNDPPVADAQSVTTAEETPTPITLTGSDPDGVSLTFTIATNPTHGGLTGSGANRTYTPDLNYVGPDSFTFFVTDSGNASSSPATVSITVTNVNDAPVANADSATTSEDMPVTVNVLGNDSDVDGDTLTVSLPSCDNGATVSVNADKTLQVSPAANFNGTIACTYKVEDGHGGSATGQVTVNVTAVNDNPVANADSATTNEDATVNVDVLANDTDPDGDSLSVTLASCGPGAAISINPNKTLKVDPLLNFNGTVTCSYTVGDGHGGSATGQLTVTVNPVNDPPTAAADSATTVEDMPVTVAVLMNDTDIDGDMLSVTSASCNNGAGIGINPNKTVTVSPAANFNGTIMCTYAVGDGHGGSANGQVTVSVTPVNDNPIAAPDQASTDDNTSIVINVLGNDTDVDLDSLSLVSTGLCTYGKLTANPDSTVNYAPKPGFSGTDMCGYTITDNNGGSASGQVTIMVNKVNDPPVLTDPVDQQTDEGTLVSLQLNASDADNDTLTFSATGLPAGLNIDPSTGLISGTPGAGSVGSHLVTVTVSDGFSGSDTTTFDWVITGVVVGDNHPPVCSAAQPSVMSLWPADHRLVPIQINGVTDPDGGQPSIMITKILQDEPTNTAGDGTTWIDGFGVGTATAQVRAERTGSPKLPGDGRVYQIFFTAADDHGASCMGSVLVSVPHDGSGVNAVDSSIRYDSTVAGGQPVAQP